MNEKIKLISGTANEDLARRIADYLEIDLCKVLISRFKDGEIGVRIDENVRGKDVFIMQPTPPPADNLMELLVMIDACYRASADRITAVIPYYGYARQDRKDQPRVPITAKLVANLITVAGAHRVLALELHAAQIQGFFDIQVDNLFAAPILLEYIRGKKFKNLTVVSPDVGGIKMGRAFAKRLGANLAIADKRRTAADASWTSTGDPRHVAPLLRNDWPLSRGTAGPFAPKYAVADEDTVREITRMRDAALQQVNP